MAHNIIQFVLFPDQMIKFQDGTWDYPICIIQIEW